MKQREHVGFFAHFMVCWYGVSLQLDAFDPIRAQMGVTAVRLHWGKPDQFGWFEFRLLDGNYGSGTFSCAWGWKWKQVGGWSIVGPLVRFVRDSL